LDYASVGVPLPSFLSEVKSWKKSRTPPPVLIRERSESRYFVFLAVPLAAKLGCRPHRENDGAWLPLAEG
jgi:hypothetical protein